MRLHEVTFELDEPIIFTLLKARLDKGLPTYALDSGDYSWYLDHSELLDGIRDIQQVESFRRDQHSAYITYTHSGEGPRYNLRSARFWTLKKLADGNVWLLMLSRSQHEAM